MPYDAVKGIITTDNDKIDGNIERVGANVNKHIESLGHSAE